MSGRAQTPLQVALRYLGFRARTESEVRKKLETAGFSVKQIETTLAQLRSHGYVNDEGFARDWMQTRAAQLGYGPQLVKQELSRRGVEPGLVHRIVSETFDHGEELARARALVERRFGREHLSSVKNLQRAAALLARRGYRRSIIEDLLAPHLEQS